MLKKFSTSLLFLAIAFSFNLAISRDHVPVKVKVTDGSEIGAPYTGSQVVSQNLDNYYQPLTTSSFTVTYEPFGLTSYYDLQSNGSPNEIWQNPLVPDNVNAACMVLPVFGGTRVVVYMLSTDRGATWSSLGNVAEAASGFPSIDGYTDNSVAVITMHTTAGGVAAARSQVFVDQGAGFGVFDRLDPGLNGTVSMIWGRVITMGSSTAPVKFAIVSSENAGTNLAGTNTYNGSAWSGWQNYAGETAEQYALALSENGNVGHAYIDPDDVGSVWFRQSTDNGLTWGSPQSVFNADMALDSQTAFRGIDCIFLNNTPYVTYEVIYQTTDGVFPTLPSRAMVWSPAVNGGVAKDLFSQANIPFYPNTGPSGSYGVFFPITRPSIGKTNSLGSNTLFASVNATTDQTAADSNVYYGVFFSVSYDAGNTWSAPEKITPSSPVRDYRYASLSHTSGTKTATSWGVQMAIQVHDYAGAFAPAEPPGPSDFLGTIVEVPMTSVTPIGTTVPDQFSLKQNFPNPFNPTTSIRFDLKTASNVTLKVYNAKGQEVATLVNNEFVSAGTKEVTFSGYEYASGVYYYTLSAGNFVETKKMMLIK